MANAGLRLLIASACIAIIGGVGYYLLSEYQASQEARAAETQRQLNATLRDGCLKQLAALNTTFSISPTERTRVANCLYMGSLTEAEVKEREEQLGVLLR